MALISDGSGAHILVVVVTRGPTRADDLPVLKVAHGTTEFLGALRAELSGY